MSKKMAPKVLLYSIRKLNRTPLKTDMLTVCGTRAHKSEIEIGRAHV